VPVAFTIEVSELDIDKAAFNKRMSQVYESFGKRYGGFARKVARNSMKRGRRKRTSEMTPQEKVAFEAAKARKRRGEVAVALRPRMPSAPGQPPKSFHDGGQPGPLKRLLRFAYERRTRSVVIGPLRGQKIAAGSKDAPRVLEEGGRIESPLPQFRGKSLKPRPYMIPAKQKADARVGAFWKQAARSFK